MAGGPFGVPRAQPRAKRVFLWKVVDSLSTVLASELKQEQPLPFGGWIFSKRCGVRLCRLRAVSDLCPILFRISY